MAEAQLRKVADDYVPLPNEGMLHEMDRSGDSKYIWDKNTPAEVEVAETMFKSFRKKGYLAFTVKGKDGAKGEQMTDFDPDAERVIFSPAMQGG